MKAATRTSARPGREGLDVRVQAVVAAIPRGRVASYGQVALLAGLPGAARQVGRVLFRLPAGSHLPWHRVVNARGGISLHPARQGSDDLQRVLLEAEGVRFDERALIDLDRFRWKGHP